MSNTSTSNDKTVGDDAKVKLIIGEIGRDTKTGIIGRGYSFDNGNTFHVTDTIFGRLYDDRDADGIWNNGMHDKVKEKVNQEITNTVEPAIKQADSAVAYANDAVEKSRVNSQAIVDINSAVSDAVSDAAVARSDGLRAWDAAQSNADLIDLNYASASAAISSARTEAIAAADEAKASASAAQADIVAVRSDVAVAKSDIAVAQTDLASQATSLSSYASQASANGADIVTLKSQAGQLEQDMASTKGDVSQLKVSASSASVALSDAAGDISQIKVDVKGMTQTISDAQGDIAKLKTRADGFDTEFASANGDISKLQTDASGTKQTLTNAKSDIAVLQSRADGFDTKYADVAGDINKLQVDASGMKQTLTDAQGNISTLQATATGFKNTLTDAQGNISTLQSDVAGLKKTTSDHAGNIATLQADAKTLTSQMSSAQGDISTLKQTASGFSSKVSGMETSLANANSKLNSITSNGGGRNMLTGTSDFTGWTIPGKVSGTTDGLIYAHLYGNAPAVAPNLTLAESTTYTVSFDALGYAAGRTDIYIGYSENSRGDILASDHVNVALNALDGASVRVSITFTTSSSFTKTNFNIGCGAGFSTGGSIYIRHVMLEKGVVAHDWQPAPEDTDAKITTNSTAIEQNKKAIALKADQTTVDKANGDVALLKAQLKVQADQINSKVSSSDLSKLSTSGRNYIKDSQSFTMTGNGTDNYDLCWNVYADAFFTNPLCRGTNKTRLSFDLTPSKALSTAKTYRIYWRQEPWTYFGTITVPAGTTDKQHYELAVTTPTTQNQASQIFMRFMADSTSDVSYTIEHSMLTIGDTFADWQPAPEDAQTYTQTQIKQTADSWNANLTSVQNDLTDKYTNLHATVDGIQAQVYNSDGSSRITQLSNLIATKVSSGDYNSQITQLKNLINQRVQVGDVISQINQEAGGNTLIQVSNGKGSLILDAGNTIVTGKAWIPVASIADLTADDIKTGTLTGSTVHLDDSNGNTIDLGALSTDYVGFHSKATNGDQTYIDLNGIHNYGSSYDTKISQGKITTNLLAVNGGGLIDFRSSGNGTTIDSRNIKFYNSNAVNGGIEFSGGSPLATVRDGTVGNELRVRYDRSFALTPIKDESARICASSAAMQVGFIQSGSSTPDRQTTGLWVDGDKRHVNLGVWGADSTWARVEANTHNIHMQADKAHAWLSSDNVFRIYKDGDSSSTAAKLQVDGWAWINGWVEAAGHSQHSALSTKTEIQPVDDDKMLEMVNDTDLATFLYKTDVANGETHRHIGLIIDDVHDVAQYQTPQDFIAPNGVSRDDDNMIGALFGAVKALTKRIKTLESKVG